MRTATIYNFLLEANIMASIAILLMIPLRRFFRKQMGSAVFCFAWLLVALRLLCPLALPNPVIHEIQSPYAYDLALRPIAGQVRVRLADATRDLYIWAENTRNAALAHSAYRLNAGLGNASVPILLMKIYLAGAAAVALWFVLANVRFRRRLRADRIGPISGELLDQYSALCKARHVKPIPVYFTDPLPSACLVGVFRPYIALPLTASPSDAPQMLLHEICHYQGKDHLWVILRLLCCVLHWFNPLVWLAAAMSRTDMELRCDSRVTKNQTPEERKAYASILVLAAAKRSAPGTPILATGMTMTGRRLKNRIVSIVGEDQRLRWLAAAFAVTATALLICAFATLDPSRSKADIFTNGDEVWQRAYADPGLASPLQTESDVIAYLRQKVTLPCFRTDIPEDAQWNAAQYRPTDWRASVIAPNGDILVESCMQTNGLFYSLYDFIPYMRYIKAEEEASLTEADLSMLADFSAQAIEMLHPGLSAAIDGEWRASLIQRDDAATYVTLIVPMRDENPNSAFILYLQLADGVPSLIGFTCGPGNG